LAGLETQPTDRDAGAGIAGTWDEGGARVRPTAIDVPPEVREALGRRIGRLAGFASSTLWFDRVSSTNDVADELAAAGAEHGTVVVAENQEQGRGRQGRTWFSPAGAGLYVSVVLRPEALGLARSPASIAAASSVTLAAGVALAEAVRAATGLAAGIKWPNDLVVEGRKVCGILAEASTAVDGIRHLVLGFGLNVLPTAFPPDILNRATSIESELGRPVDAAALLAEALARLAEQTRAFAAGGIGAILDQWRALSPSCKGARVEVTTPLGWRAATTAGVDGDGALLVRLADDGGIRRVIAGEVRWLP
jgi:BirA family transcriptional regulator, biotin operon repressor / biotin---[acetyl-CoA-carboxylase] ligase